MKESAILNDVLWLALEDVSGLWEILWDLKSHYPTMPEAERKTAALAAVRKLLNRGWIEFYRCLEPGGGLQKLPPDGIKTALTDPKSWQPPEPGTTSIRIGATDSGRRVLTGDKIIED